MSAGKCFHACKKIMIEKSSAMLGAITEVILLGVIAGRFPNKKLHWDIEKGRFKESAANKFLDSEYRIF